VPPENDSVLQSAAFIVVIPAFAVADVDASLVECPAKIDTSIPASLSISHNQ